MKTIKPRKNQKNIPKTFLNFNKNVKVFLFSDVKMFLYVFKLQFVRLFYTEMEVSKFVKHRALNVNVITWNRKRFLMTLATFHAGLGKTKNFPTQKVSFRFEISSIFPFFFLYEKLSKKKFFQEKNAKKPLKKERKSESSFN